MSENNNKPNQPTDDGNETQSTDVKSGRSTNDLRAAADEALRMFNEAQKKAKQQTVTDLEEAEAKAREIKAQLDDAASEEPAHTDDKPSEIGNTTHDLAKAAYEAMQMSEKMKQQAAITGDIEAMMYFGEDMLLRLSVLESSDVLTVDVTGDMVVGRADNVTDYIPAIDLTPYGAYRLGLSRRHATFVRRGDTLQVVDLQSRNGTFINNNLVPKGGAQTVKDGDEVRFGNLGVRVSFHKKEDASSD